MAISNNYNQKQSFHCLVNILMQHLFLQLNVRLQDVHWNHIQHTFGLPYSGAQVIQIWNIDSQKDDKYHDEEYQELIEFELSLFLKTCFEVIDEEVSQSFQSVIDVLQDIGQ